VASGKVARRADASEIAALLDSPEIADLIGQLCAVGDPRGRKGYGARALVGACLVKTLYGLPTWTRVASLLSDHPGLQEALGGSPSVWACYRFTAWVKTRDLKPAGNFKLMALGTKGRALSFQEGELKSTQEWAPIDIVFNTLGEGQVSLYAGIWGGVSGKVWIDDLHLEELALVELDCDELFGDPRLERAADLRYRGQSFELRVPCNAQIYVEIACGAAADSRFAVAGYADSAAVVDARRHFDGELALQFPPAASGACGTRRLNDLTIAVALRAG